MFLLDYFLDILFPKRCISCLKLVKDDTIFCEDCLNKIRIFNSFFCPKCSARIPEFKKICHKEEKFILGAATDYNDIVKQAIWRLKFKFIKRGAYPLANLLINYFKNLDFKYKIDFIVIPISLSKKRFKERGFNQSELIAQIFANYFNFELETNVLYREKHSKPQSEIDDFNLRKQNVLNCFKVLNKDLILNKNIILIDDVTTSGATFKEAVKVLKESGAKSILALAVAKA
jgi:ComF family protein